MGGRVVDRARLESVFTFIGNEGSNPSPSGFCSYFCKSRRMFDSRLVFLNNNGNEVIMKFPVEIDREEESRCIDKTLTIPGCNYYGVSKEDASNLEGPGVDEPLTRNPTIGGVAYYSQDGNAGTSPKGNPGWHTYYPR